MVENKASYRQIFKATSIFGGVQVFNIIIGVLRAKFVAVLLGTSGYGIFGLLNAPLAFIANLTGLGINFSAIRDISAANETGEDEKLSITLVTFRRWVWITGLLGMIVTIILSPWLSKWSFGNYNYTFAFILVSVTLLINSVSNGQSAVLRGTRRIKDTAKAGVIGSALGLVTSLPLYYLYGLKGIVPSVIIASLVALLLSWLFSRRVKTVPVNVGYRDSLKQGKSMVKLGVMMTLTGIITTAITYIVSAFIRYKGGISQVGLYNAGWSITNQYVGMVFAAMAADYFPKLSGIHHDNTKVRDAVNQQAEVAILIIAPIMLVYLSSLPILVPLLYSKEFLAIIPFTQWVIIGMLFKTASWTMGFILLAKGDTKLFFWTEFVANMMLLIFNVGGYAIFGIEGIGIGFVALYIAYFFILFFVCRKKYDFKFSHLFKRIFLIQFIICLIAFSIAYLYGYPIGYISGGMLLLISSIYSLKELNSRIDIKEVINRRKNKR